MKPKTINVTDEREFEAVYNKYQAMVMKEASGFLHDYHMAQDVCQETFLRLGFYFDEMPRKKRKPWLIVVAGNYSKDLLRKGGRYNITVGLQGLEELELQAENEIEKYLKKIATREFTVEALLHLREKKILWYEILVLVECLNIPKHRVAEEYQVSVQSLDGYLRRAKDWIRTEYGDSYRRLYK